MAYPTRNSRHNSPPHFIAQAQRPARLAFVAISLNLDADPPGQPARRAVETLAVFAYPLAASLLIQLPGLSGPALGIGQAILTAGLVALAAAIDVPH